MDDESPMAVAQVGVRFWLPAAIFVTVFGIYALTAGHDKTHIDAHAAMVESWHIAATGSPWLEGDLNAAMRSNKFIGEAGNGHIVGLRMAGPVVMGIPLYWLLNNEPDPGQFSYVPGALTAALLAAAAVTMLYLALRTRVRQVHALAVAGAFAFTTPTWTVSADTMWTHPVTQLGIAGAAFGASKNRWWFAGVCLALGMLGRPHIALVAALVGIGAGLASRSIKPVLAVALPTVTCLGVLAAWNRWMFGSWSIGGAYGDRTEAALGGFEGSAEWDGALPQLTNYLGFLFSLDRGLLIWTPAILLMVPSVVRAWRKVPSWSRWLAAGGVVYTIAQLRINYFPGGDGFWGYRHALELVTCILPLLAFAIPHLGRTARLLLPPVIAAQFAVMSVGALVTGYSVLIQDVWTDNGFWLALRSQPAVLGTWLLLCVAVGVVMSVVLDRRIGSGHSHRDRRSLSV